MRGEFEQRGVEVNGLPNPLQHGALEIVVEEDTRHRVEACEGRHVAAQEVGHGIAEEKAQEDLARVAQHHHEAPQRALGAAEGKEGFRQVDFKQYLATLAPEALSRFGSEIAVVVAQGEIVPGERPPGTIGGKSTAQLVRAAREDDEVKAIVLRIDSPGGSAQASEVMWQAARRAGKLSQSMMRLVDQLLAPKLPWRALLARYMMNAARDDYSFQRASRREGEAMMPRLSSQSVRVVVVLDSSGSIGDETSALAALRRRPTWLPDIRARIDAAFRTTADRLRDHPHLEWIEPSGGVVGFPRIRSDVRIDVDRVCRVLSEEPVTVVGRGRWCEQPRRHFRLGYGWPAPDELAGGLDAIDLALRASIG